MHVAGFTIVRNAIQYDYPVVESIRSALPLVDEMTVAVGDSHDGTRELIQSIGSAKIRIVDTVWDRRIRSEGRILAQQTNLAMSHAKGDWLLYLQADEVLHENDLDRVEHRMRKYQPRPSVEGLSFRYHHFRAAYDIRDPLPYRRQVRVIRPGIGIESVGDACGFAINGRKLRAAGTGAWVYHYGYVKPPEHMSAKMDYFLSLYDGRDVCPEDQAEHATYAWNLSTCEPFVAPHPAVMAERIARQDWETPQVTLYPRWRNPKFWSGLAHKNTRTFRRWASSAQRLVRNAA